MSQRTTVAILLTGIALLVLLPVLLGAPGGVAKADGRRVVIVTPHNEQIRTEFGDAFARWHEDAYGEPVTVAWSVPGGTSEIRALLESQWLAALERGDVPGGFADLVFGGGSYEHGRLADGVQLRRSGLTREHVRALLGPFFGEQLDAALNEDEATLQAGHVHAELTRGDNVWTVELGATVSVPAGLDMAGLPERYGRSSIGGVRLWDEDGHWVGTALSSFGLIANLDELRRLNLPEPASWTALANPRLQGLVSMVNPAQSGSVTTAFEALLSRLGWTRGWQVLRRAAANARTISASALRGPMDVAAGDAAMGVCIDFFGRGESQALADHGDPDRIVYVDPAGETTIDPDPISMLADPPDHQLAGRFIEFTLTDEAQGLWQLPPGSEGGPEQFALRRIPITDSAWERDGTRYLDAHARPGALPPPPFADRNSRAFIAPLLSAMALDQRDALEAAWTAIISHPAYPDTDAVVTAADVDDTQLAAMLEAFDAMPVVPGPDGDLAVDDAADRGVIKRGRLRGGFDDLGMWHEQQRGIDAFRQACGAFFAEQYATVVQDGGS